MHKPTSMVIGLWPKVNDLDHSIMKAQTFQMISNTAIQFNILHHGCDFKTLCPYSYLSPDRNSDIYMALSTAILSY